MAKLIRWKCFILICITIADSTGFKPTEVDISSTFFGCSLGIKQKLSDCLGKCTEVSCHFQELQHFLSACSKGTRQTCKTIPTPSTTTTTTPIPPQCQPCGMANLATARRIGGRPNRGRPSKPTRGSSSKPNRIVGGVEVNPPRKYPWQVALVVSGKIGCGGSIINNRWILTAAHCLIDTGVTCEPRPSNDRLQIRIGEHIISTNMDNDPINTRDYDIKRYVIHPELECPGINKDFALVEVTGDIPFNNVIRPVCLPENDSKTYAGVTGTVSGWGLTIDGDKDSVSDVLMEVDVPIVAQSDCRGWGPLPDAQLCAGPVTSPPPGKDSCQGDSGGPLVVKEGNTYIQVGVVSYGGPCGKGTQSAVYARVSKVIDWIKKTTASGKC